MISKKQKYFGALIIATILLFSFKGKNKKTTPTEILFPDTTRNQNVFSQIGTVVYDENGNKLFTYDTAGLGMKVLQYTGTYVYVQYDTNKNGYVLFSQVTT
jgi:hypothetical protein